MCVFCFVLFLAVLAGSCSPNQESCPSVPAAVEAWNPNPGLPDNFLKPEVLRELENETKKINRFTYLFKLMD